MLVHYQPSTTTNCILIYPKSKYNVAEQVENNIYAYFYLDLCSINVQSLFTFYEPISGNSKINDKMEIQYFFVILDICFRDIERV